MPRTSRAVAQRLASQKAKKRRPARPSTPVSSVSVDQILDEVVPSEAGPRAASTPTFAPPAPASPPTTEAKRRATASASARASGRPAAPRRRYAEYGTEYAYVTADLRRIVVVAGLLIALLVVLEIVLRP